MGYCSRLVDDADRVDLLPNHVDWDKASAFTEFRLAIFDCRRRFDEQQCRQQEEARRARIIANMRRATATRVISPVVALKAQSSQPARGKIFIFHQSPHRLPMAANFGRRRS